MRALWATLLVIVVAGGVGCYDSNGENRDRPGGPLYEKWTASGDRVLVVDADGETVGKFRRETSGWKVYDRELRPVGEVRSDEESKRVVMEPTGGESRAIEPVGEGRWSLGENYRMLRTDSGWTIERSDGVSEGRVTHDDGAWVLRDATGTERMRTAGDEGRALKGEDGRTWRVVGDDLPAPLLLASALGELPALERAAFGLWLGRRGGGDGADQSDAGSG